MGRFQGDLPERTFQFALLAFELVDGLPNRTKGWVVGRQLLRSATSIGANVREADNAVSRAEFISICNIALREAGETSYWLRLCKEAGMLAGDQLTAAESESEELARILATIVRNSRQSSDRK